MLERMTRLSTPSINFPREQTVEIATLIALLAFNFLGLIYAVSVFVQFSYVEVLATFLVFQVIWGVPAIILLRPRLRMRATILMPSAAAALLVLGFLVYFFCSQSMSSMPSYAKTFPVLEVELGLSWHQDTAFHVSLIQSILSYAFPSIGQHGHPLTAYHVLSHYVDTLILLVTGVDPFDSYGMLSHFKVVLFLSSALLMIARLCREHGLPILLLSVALLLPALIGSWHGVLSHGLWIPSLLLLLCAPSVVDLLSQDEPPGIPQLAWLGLLIVLLALGKVSAGFMFACFMGLWLFAKAPLCWRTLVFGVLVLTFFYGYGQLFIGRLNHIESPVELSGIGFSSLWSYFSAPDIVRAGKRIPSLMPQLLMLSALLLSIAIMRPSRRNFQVLFAAALSLLCLWGISATSPGLSVSDIWYFQYALSSVMLIISYALILDTWRDIRGDLQGAAFRRMAVLALGFALFSASQLRLSGYNAFNLGPANVQAALQYLRDGPFVQINKRLPVTQRFELLQGYHEKRVRLLRLQQKSSLWAFKHYMRSYLYQSSITPAQAALFVPNTVFDGELKRLRGAPWANGMLLYAVFGVPLVNAVPEGARGYGFAAYGKDAHRVDLVGFSLSEACAASGARRIWVVERIKKPSARPQDCAVKQLKN